MNIYEFEAKRKQFVDVYDASKRLEKQLNQLKLELVPYMKEHARSIKLPDGRTMNFQSQDRGKLDEEVLIGILEEKGLDDCIKIQKHVNELALKVAVAKGRITLEDISPASNPKITEFIKIDPVKK